MDETPTPEQEPIASPVDAPKPQPTPGHYPPYDEHRTWRVAHLWTLVTDPSTYAREHLQYAPSLAVGLMVWICGAAVVLQRFNMEAAQEIFKHPGNAKTLAASVPEWSTLWMIVVLAGMIGGPLRWLVGGWWYGVRLEWCGDRKFNRDYARVVFMHSEFLWTLPTLAFALVDTAIYPNFGAAMHAPHNMLLPLVVLCSYGYSYLLVRSSFEVKRGWTIFWFLAAPASLTFITLFVAFVAGVVAALRAIH